ncbi:hypothetical protein KSS87_011233 [Heliosperma pusillum]|nr:hypothetical protein KSS87_011233 [Heliosperma pusillum]
MPASPSETRPKWRKTRGPKTTKRHRPEDEDDDDDDDDIDEVEEDEDLHPNPNPNPNANPKPNSHTREVIPGSGIRISNFPPAVKYSVNLHHSFVMTNGVVLENVSHGQLQVLSAVPADCSGLVGTDQESSFVVTPPTVLEGKGVVRTLWNRRIVLPLHSGTTLPVSIIYLPLIKIRLN